MGKKFFLLVILALGILSAEKLSIVRLSITNYKDIEQFLLTNFDKAEMPEIAAGRPGEWYDLIVNENQLSIIENSGIKYQIVVEDLKKAKEKVKDSYHSYQEVVSILRNIVQTNPDIARLDSIGPSYEGRWIYGIKISDNVSVDEDEPEHLFSGCHHAREWASVEVPVFFADTLTRAYGIDPVVTNLVNTREIWIFPIINVDGYVYDYSNGGAMWRKNREPFGGALGTDLNRNYNGICDTNAIDGWGVINSSSVSHYPSHDVFCGKSGNSAREVQKYVEFIKSREFVTILDYHTYSELVLAPWGHKNDPTPHDNVYNLIGQGMAQRIQRLGGGNYTYQKSINLYPTSGGSSDYEYGWNIFVNGRPCVALVVEMGTQFYQSTGDLPSIKRENFEGAVYLMQQAEYILANMKTYVPAPEIISPSNDTVRDTLKIEWHLPEIRFFDLSGFEIQFFKGPHAIDDNFENGTNFWVLEGFSRSSLRRHSGNYSVRSDSVNNLYSQIRTKYPYYVNPGDSLKYWVYYDLETNYDVGIVEVSENLREWIPISGERLTGNSGGWIRVAYSLSNFAGKTLYFRFRCLTDQSVLREGIYIDDVYPVATWDSIWSFTGLMDTFLIITNLPEGEYYFRVAGYSSTFGRGNFSPLRRVYFSHTTSVTEIENMNSYVSLLSKNNFARKNVKFLLNGKNIKLSIYDIQGREVWNMELREAKQKVVSVPIPAQGVYFYVSSANGLGQQGKFLVIE
ncbi:MAG: M14 family zinc carboxypeptidase [Candidatus Hydrothermia bacterium]